MASLYTQLVDRKIDPLTEVLVTTGAYEALYASIQGHVDEGDEVIIIEPYFDCYEPMVKMAGGVPRFIPLRLVRKQNMSWIQFFLLDNSSIHIIYIINEQNKTSDEEISSADWVLDDAELANLFNEKTKMIILNTPNNPLGKVFKRCAQSLFD